MTESLIEQGRNNNPQGLLTVKQVARLLGVKEKTLYQWASLGQIPHIRKQLTR